MYLDSTTVVRPEDERPARRDGTCFYCQEPIGSLHQKSCVVPQKTVILEVKIEMPLEVPAFWSEKDIDYFFNESSSCSDNLISDIERVQRTRHLETGKCLCGCIEVDFLREADVEDHEEYGLPSN